MLVTREGGRERESEERNPLSSLFMQPALFVGLPWETVAAPPRNILFHCFVTTATVASRWRIVIEEDS